MPQWQTVCARVFFWQPANASIGPASDRQDSLQGFLSSTPAKTTAFFQSSSLPSTCTETTNLTLFSLTSTRNRLHNMLLEKGGSLTRYIDQADAGHVSLFLANIHYTPQKSIQDFQLHGCHENRQVESRAGVRIEKSPAPTWLADSCRLPE